MDERRKHARAITRATPLIVRLVLGDGSKQMGVIDDQGDGSACIGLNGVVNEIAAGDVVDIECEAQPRSTPDAAIPSQELIAWITGRHLRIQFLS